MYFDSLGREDTYEVWEHGKRARTGTFKEKKSENTELFEKIEGNLQTLARLLELFRKDTQAFEQRLDRTVELLKQVRVDISSRQ